MQRRYITVNPLEGMQMGRVVEANASLAKSLNKGTAADLWKMIRAAEGAAA